MEKIYEKAEVNSERKCFDPPFAFKIIVLFILLTLGCFKDKVTTGITDFAFAKADSTPTMLQNNSVKHFSAVKGADLKTVSITTD
jgi:hypothetical protein